MKKAKACSENLYWCFSLHDSVFFSFSWCYSLDVVCPCQNLAEIEFPVWQYWKMEPSERCLSHRGGSFMNMLIPSWRSEFWLPHSRNEFILKRVGCLKESGFLSFPLLLPLSLHKPAPPALCPLLCVEAAWSPHQMQLHNLGFFSHQNCESNKPIFFLNYPALGLLLQQYKMD